MKKIILLIAVLLALAFASCESMSYEDGYNLGYGIGSIFS